MARGMSASSNTINGALPPSSSPTFLTVPAACRASIFPTSVEPVNVTMRTRGSVESTSPTATGSLQVMILNTPFGTPARSASSAKANADNGVSSAGFTTTVHPAAMAGVTLRVIMALGKFHGVIAATTPIGCLMTRMRASALWAGMTSP